MTATIIDGRRVAENIRGEVRDEIEAMRLVGLPAPALHVVLCSNDPASAVYVRGKARASDEVGVRSTVHTPPADVTTEQLLELLGQLAGDDAVDAILVQLPLHPQIDQDAVLNAVPPAKDVDGLHPVNVGLLAQGRPGVSPCTPLGCMELLKRYRVPVRGARAVVVGRSTIVGRPMAMLLTNADATVTLCHSRTGDLPAVCREADILVAAIGRAGMIDGGYVKPGACVIDVGINRVEGGLRGDVDRASVEPIAGWLTPVPRGVGPMTIAQLLRNTVTVARSRRTAASVGG